MYRKFNILLIIILSFSTQYIYGQRFSNIYFEGAGARAAGMGNAFIGLADDVTAIAWNAAGLTQLKTPQSSVVARFGSGSMSVEGFEPGGIDQWDVDLSAWSNLNFIGMAASQKLGNINFGGGLAFRRMYNLSIEEKNTLRGPALGDSTLVYNDNSEGGLDALSISVAAELHKMFSIGVTTNILFGEEDGFRNISINNQQNPDQYERYSISYSGFSAEFGLMFLPTKYIRLGANILTSYSITAKPKEGESTKITLPNTYAVGLSIVPAKRLILSSDYRYQPMSTVEVDGITLGDSLGYEDNHSFHVGLEYLLTGRKTSYPVRAGFYTNSASKSLLNPEMVFTVGGGITWGNFTVNAAFEYFSTSFDDQETFNVTDPPLVLDIQRKTQGTRITVEATVFFVGM
jgi:long-subunit fatty acid transport protein